MRELLVETKSEEDAQGEACTCSYYVLVDEMEVAGGFACESYGVKVALDGEAVSIPNITTSVTRIDALMELLTRNFVTPSTLRDVIEDWL